MKTDILAILPFLAMMAFSVATAFKIAAEFSKDKVGAYLSAAVITVCCLVVIAHIVIKLISL